MGSFLILCRNNYFIAPSGVQKERIQAEGTKLSEKEWRVTVSFVDMFVVDPATEKVLASPPPAKGFRPSQCTPLFINAYTMRGAGAVIHTHSQVLSFW